MVEFTHYFCFYSPVFQLVSSFSSKIISNSQVIIIVLDEYGLFLQINSQNKIDVSSGPEMPVDHSHCLSRKPWGFPYTTHLYSESGVSSFFKIITTTLIHLIYSYCVLTMDQLLHLLFLLFPHAVFYSKLLNRSTYLLRVDLGEPSALMLCCLQSKVMFPIYVC